jgi:multiple sugar transport system substrate-binding protein
MEDAMAQRTRFLTSLGLAGLLGVAALAGCGDDPRSSDRRSESDPVTLSYWSDSTNIDKVVKLWNGSHPDIQVKLTDPGGKDEIVAKLLAANRGGDAPDMADVEYAHLSQLVVGGGAMDITKYVEDSMDAFADATRANVTLDDAIYAVPLDVGPMMMIYRKDVLDKLEIAVPSTWEDFAAAAASVRTKAPDAYLAQFSPENTLFFAGMCQQAGATWWSVNDGEWTVNIDGPESRAVARYWQDLVDRDLVSTELDWTPAWSTALNKGTILTGPMAVWGVGSVDSLAPKTAGKWAVAPVPSWGGSDVVGHYGGSASVITASSRHPEQAAEFLLWMEAGDGAHEIGKTQYPASVEAQKALSTPRKIIGGQEDFYDLATESAGRLAEVTWGPNTAVAVRAFEDGFTKALADGTSLEDALHDVQDATVKNMRSSGFTVHEGP